MNAPEPAVLFFCLAAGAAMGVLFQLFRMIRLLLRGGKLLTAALDVLFCCICAAAVFLCALAVDKGRIRAFQVCFHLVGAWAAVVFLDPFASCAAALLRKAGEKLSGCFRRLLRAIFPKRKKKCPERRKKRIKTRKRPKKV